MTLMIRGFLLYNCTAI
ncbi:hypothetical protein E2C01_087653 [Portunus trituberculatus]|uniref:Uncharacterized protein n=1 Tax=Portunus trituberculatus TaxID=210409 RepID=A0A5B7JHV2_PORTR|nr:hypothetical protein [Portunus trituberculatus]